MGNRSPWRRLRRVFRQEPAAEVDDELKLHLKERVREYIGRGMDPEAARKAALERLGDLERVRDECMGLLKAERRTAKRRASMSVSWLDVKLGVRMLVKHPGLSLVAVSGMAVAIAIGTSAFGFIASIMDPALPLPEDERVVSIRNSVITEAGQNRQTVHDFVLWRDQLTAVQDLAAFTTDQRNLVIPGGDVELVRIAQMTASGFEVARTTPALGRPLLEDDERAGAPPVVVIAYEEWQRRFDGDPDIVGRSVRFGNTVHTVVGVMPEGFRFPVNHRYWVPLRLNASNYEWGGGPALFIFGRLAEGATLDNARAELTLVGSRTAAAHPETHEHLRPRILPYAYHFFGIDSPYRTWLVRTFQSAFSLLLVVVAANVAVLVYARTATRASEIAVRTALGATRARVIAQLFAEGLVLSGTAAVIGLTVAGVGLARIQEFLVRASGDYIPFWLNLSLSPAVITYALGLAILGGVIVGVLPALRATGGGVHPTLQQLSSRGSQMRLGRTWTALIVGQVAIVVAALPFAVHGAAQWVERGLSAAGYPAEELLRASLSMERAASPPAAEAAAYERAFDARFRDRAAELLRRLEAEPAVAGVAFASDFPGSGSSGFYGTIEVEGFETSTESTARQSHAQRATARGVWTNHVDTDLFAVFDVPILAGRGFVQADVREGSTAVIIDRTFAEQVLGGGDVLGRRFRYAPEPGDPGPAELEANPWLEVVGVVPNFTIRFDGPYPLLYRPISVDRLSTGVYLAIRVRTQPASAFAARLREIAVEVDPGLQIHGLRSAAHAERESQRRMRYLAMGIAVVTLSVLLLSAAGIYAMMSFTVARRRREIGIRTALGADPRRVLSGVFARAGAQLGAGVVVGLSLSWAVDPSLDVFGDEAVIVAPAVAVLIIGVGLLAALGPARRALSIQPSEALRDE